jgi:serine/threonine-protein kinase
MVANIKHPNVWQVYHFDRVGDVLYVVGELLDGSSLDAYTRTPWDVAEACRVLRPVAEALDYVHRLSQPVIHRDVKPSNIMMVKDGNVILVDFGVAKIISQDLPRRDLTIAGYMIGTAQYMSPEQVEGAEIGPRSDQYALGIVAYELLTGRPPFRGAIPSEVARRRLHAPPQPPSALNTALPGQADGVILQALARQPEQRFPDCVSFVQALAAAVPLTGRSEQRT